MHTLWRTVKRAYHRRRNKMDQKTILLHLINLLYEGGWIKEREKENWKMQIQQETEHGQ